jgi:hypothetical protein
MERHNDDQLDIFNELKQDDEPKDATTGRSDSGYNKPGHVQDCAWCGKPLNEGGQITRLGYVHHTCAAAVS